MTVRAISLAEFNNRITALFASAPQIKDTWVTAELSDVRRAANGHCYMELIQKDSESGAAIARLRAVIWANVYSRLSADFTAATGQRFADGLKVMVCISAGFHRNYGLSATITDINPEYTMGDLLRQRREILMRLEKEGILELNRQLQWTEAPLRIAVISAKGAAGYGDFIHQLYSNPSHMKFHTELFAASMQGENTVPSVIAALEQIASDIGKWDGVVIIRGGGSTSDLNAFDNYELAANIAQFPLPVIIGIGHERDITVLDYVANMRVKTPTAAAEWLISRGKALLERINAIATDILTSAQSLITGSRCLLLSPTSISTGNSHRKFPKKNRTLCHSTRRNHTQTTATGATANRFQNSVAFNDLSDSNRTPAQQNRQHQSAYNSAEPASNSFARLLNNPRRRARCQ